MDGKRWVLYQDSLRVHKSKLTREAYEELGIKVVWSPYYSPDYNSIEFWFSWLKREVKKLRLLDMIKKKRRTYRQLIPLVLKNVNKKLID